MTKLNLMLVFIALSSYCYSQTETLSKKPTENKLITTDFIIGYPHALKFTINYYNDEFVYAVSAGLLSADVNIGFNIFTREKLRLSWLASYGVTELKNGNVYAGIYFDLLLWKHLKINLGGIRFDKHDTRLYAGIGYSINLYSNK